MLKRNLLLLAGVIALAAVPLVVYRPSEDKEIFAGADGQAEEVIGEVKPEYEPWYQNFWEPPSGEIESMLDWVRLIREPTEAHLADVVSEIDALTAVAKVRALLELEPARFAADRAALPLPPRRHLGAPLDPECAR